MEIDVIKQIGAITRGVRDTERQGRAAKTVMASRTFATDAADLWNAITDPERLQRWFAPVSGDLRIGGRYELKGNASGTITACESPKHLALTWEFAGDVSWVSVNLTPESDDSTRLDLEHTSIPGDHYEKYGPAATGIGWTLSLVGLQYHLQGGKREDAEAWSMAEGGKDFIRKDADAWCTTDEVSGTDPAHARKTADATAAFYTGEAAE